LSLWLPHSLRSQSKRGVEQVFDSAFLAALAELGLAGLESQAFRGFAGRGRLESHGFDGFGAWGAFLGAESAGAGVACAA